MGEPERQVWSEGQCIEQAIFTSRRANFDDAAGCRSEIGDIVLREQERCRLGAAAGREGHEDRPKLGFKLAADMFAAMRQGAQDCAGAMRQNFLIQNQYEIFETVRAFSRAKEIRFRSEWDVSQIFERANGVSGEAKLVENFAIVS